MNPSPPTRFPQTNPNPVAKPRYVMMGGFLGAGKTTSILHLAQRLANQDRRIGLISNDQGRGLVDTALFSARRFPVEEIPGGCFCCRFNSLVEASQRLSTAARPDVFIAEPVGSCTDLVATVIYPLRQIYGEHYTLAPFSVIVDPIRAARVLELEAGARFSDKVVYIYRKQLEEADIIVINKRDLIDASRRQALRTTLANEFPKAQIFEVSARRAEGLDSWFDHVMNTEQQPRAVIDMDYETYAEGEALLGWLNGTIQVRASEAFDANVLLQRLAREIQMQLAASGAEVAHLKMTLDPQSVFGDLASASLVRTDFVPELSFRLQELVTEGQLTINLRAEAEPDVLRRVVEEAVRRTVHAHPAMTAKWQSLESFKPGKPQPTHRVTAMPGEANP